MSGSDLAVHREHDQHAGLCLAVAAVPLVALGWLLRSSSTEGALLAVLALLVAPFFSWGALRHLRDTWPVNRLPPDPLAIGWEVDDFTWWRFWAAEARSTPRDSIRRLWPVVVGIWILGGCGLGFLAVVPIVALGVLWHVRGALAVGRTVELRGDTLHVGGLPYLVRGGGQALLLASIDRLRDPAALELEVSRPGGAGASATVRAPVPADRLKEAEMVLAWLDTPA